MTKQEYIDAAMEERWPMIQEYPATVTLLGEGVVVMAHFVGDDLGAETLAIDSRPILHHAKGTTTIV